MSLAILVKRSLTRSLQSMQFRVLTDGATSSQTDFETYKLNWPKGGHSENSVNYFCILPDFTMPLVSGKLSKYLIEIKMDLLI